MDSETQSEFEGVKRLVRGKYSISFPGVFLAATLGFLVGNGLQCQQDRIEDYVRRINGNVNFLDTKVDHILKKELTPTLQVKNVIGNERPDTFYEINGQRVYLTIDGQPVEAYVKKGE